MDVLNFKLTQLIPFLIIYGIIVFFLNRNKKTSIIQQIINLSFFIYILLVVGNSFLPLPLSEAYIQLSIDQGTEGINKFIPFTDISNIIKYGSFSVITSQIIGDLILLAPLGFYAPLIWTKFKNIKTILLLGLISSAVVESTQLIISTIIGYTYRSFITDDIILYTIGVLMGFLTLKITSPLLRVIANQNDIKNDHANWLLSLRRL
ncbi:VanZ family protein [Virgibacillus salexigens]|uniref:VanZ family protein n=1 Tax=Virgibacillus salexigens TaxID=61016 RepID=UPI003081E9E1